MSSQEHLVDLLARMRAKSSEVDWCEFKVDNFEPERIGKYISALSNAAAYDDEPCGYLFWGIENESHNVIGTTFQPEIMKYGNQPLEFWLHQSIKPSLNFRFHILEVEGCRVVALEVPAPHEVTVKYKDIAYIRVGTATPKLSDYPSREAQINSKLRKFVWGKGVSARRFGISDVNAFLDLNSYASLLGYGPFADDTAYLAYLLNDGVLVRDGEKFCVTNLGAILFAKHLEDFENVRRKPVRVIVYKDKNRTETEKEQLSSKGYAAGYSGIIKYLNDILPRNEEIVRALRVEKPVYPEIAIRELVANALIHQDMTVGGAGPMIEVFKDRIEITNPGIPLIETQRLLDLPPRSRNESLAYLMRRMKMCEERGSGIDKVIASVELYQLPPPDFRIDGDNFRVVLFAPKAFKDMDNEQRLRACYQHAVLKFVSGDGMTNTSFRERLGVEVSHMSQVSKIITQTVNAKLIKRSESWNPATGHYLPYWA